MKNLALSLITAITLTAQPLLASHTTITCQSEKEVKVEYTLEEGEVCPSIDIPNFDDFLNPQGPLQSLVVGNKTWDKFQISVGEPTQVEEIVTFTEDGAFIYTDSTYFIKAVFVDPNGILLFEGIMHCQEQIISSALCGGGFTIDSNFVDPSLR